MNPSLVTGLALLVVGVTVVVAGVQFFMALCRPRPRRLSPGPAMRTNAGGEMDRVAYLRLQALQDPDSVRRLAPRRRRPRRGAAG